MQLSDDLAAWVSLAKAPGLDPESLLVALDRLGSARGVLCAPEAERELAGIPTSTRDFLRAQRGLSAAELHWLESPSHCLLPLTDPKYPQLLRAAPDRPLALYVAGNVDALADPPLAIVGSRNPTAQGSETAFEFAHTLSSRGLAIVSGLAAGIDTAAHRGAIRAQGVTIAILGSGIDALYPRENADLGQIIERDGALASEFPLGTPPRRGNFPARNRTMAGLSLGTLVVEAARRSGSMITARAARSLGRALLAVPGSIHNPLSRGCHELIRGGARLVETPDDILRELNCPAFFSGHAALSPGARTGDLTHPGMDKDHKILLDALGFDPVDLDTLIVRTGFKPEAVSSMMLILELEGYVQAAPGGRYSRVANRRAGGER
jgi:DNA processing protein